MFRCKSVLIIFASRFARATPVFLAHLPIGFAGGLLDNAALYHFELKWIFIYIMKFCMNKPTRHILNIRPRECILDKRAPLYEATHKTFLLMNRLKMSIHPSASLKRSMLTTRFHSASHSGTGRRKRQAATSAVLMNNKDRFGFRVDHNMFRVISGTFWLLISICRQLLHLLFEIIINNPISLTKSLIIIFNFKWGCTPPLKI